MSAPTKVKGRIIRDCAHGAINHVIEVDAADIAQFVGDVDFDQNSVAYAEQIAREKIDADALAAEDAYL